MKKYLISFFLIVVFNNNAYAYLDPGTGSIILQALIAFVAAFFSWIIICWHKFKAFLIKIKEF